MKMNSDDKFNVVTAFKSSALLCWSDLESLIGADLSAWAAAFAHFESCRRAILEPLELSGP